jgi:putative membrane protein
MATLVELARLLAGTFVHRPYVFAFLGCYLVLARRQLGGRGLLLYTGLSYAIAFGAEYSSTRDGFPFGRYVYVDGARSTELWISNVPLWDSLSFVFLSYFSWILAAGLLAPRGPGASARGLGSAMLGGALMMLLDVVIDPLTLLGDRWFLGRIYYYPEPGPYFGVTVSNFGGWFLVGAATIAAFQRVSGMLRLELGPVPVAGAAGVYAGVLLFNLTITAWIGEWRLFAASAAVAGATLAACFARLRHRSGRGTAVAGCES